MHDNWSAGDAYESYMGRWSRPLARSFLTWLHPPTGAHWLDVGCGTGALTSAICDLTAPASVVACDPSASFVSHARSTLPGCRAAFVVANAEHLPELERPADFVVSGLVLNFLPDPARAIRAMCERVHRNGIIAAYVWDYQEGMEFLRRFWDEAAAIDSAAAGLHEGNRFPLCRRGGLNTLLAEEGIREVAAGALEVTTSFADFDDFWTPFLTGTGPAPSYVATLPETHRNRLRERLLTGLKTEADGRIVLKARAWTVTGRVSVN